MNNINMRSWIEQVKASKERITIPIMTHPGIELIGKDVVDACRDGETHFKAILALNELYPAAATTVIMDLTVEAEAFGAEVIFPTHEVPSVVGRLVSSPEEIESLLIPTLEAGRIPEYLKANRLTAEAIEDKPVLSGVIGPFSLAGRLYDMTEIMMAIYVDPNSIHTLLEKCTAFIINYIQALKATGVNGVVVAEPAAGLLSNSDTASFSSFYIEQIVKEVQDDYFVLILHNCGNTGHSTQAMTSTGAAAYHFGNKIDMVKAIEDSPEDVLVMGNIDPVSIMKEGNAQDVYHRVKELLAKCQKYNNFVLSTGCDIPPHTPPENIKAYYRALSDYNDSLSQK